MTNHNRELLVLALKSHRQKMKPKERERSRAMFRGKQGKWLYPWATEKKYSGIVSDVFAKIADKAVVLFSQQSQSLLNGDSQSRADVLPGRGFHTVVATLSDAWKSLVPQTPVDGSQLLLDLDDIANDAYEFNADQWKKQVKTAVGFAFDVGSTWWESARKAWTDQNYSYTWKIGNEFIGKVSSLAEQAIVKGADHWSLMKEIRSLATSLTENKSRFLARDQLGKLNGNITHARLKGLGLDTYIWQTAGDERVRDSHREMEGMICDWDDASIWSSDGKKWEDRSSDATDNHPGIDPQCRCCALPDFSSLIEEADDELESNGGEYAANA